MAGSSHPIVAVVELEDGSDVGLTTNLVDVTHEDLRASLHVEAFFEQRTEHSGDQGSHVCMPFVSPLSCSAAPVSAS